jgi:glucose-6-phosphate isomerase
MFSAHDLLTRWPALGVAARRDRLHGSLRVSPGHLTDHLSASADRAERAAAGLWTRDPSALSDVAGVQKEILKRLGWMTSPALMADSLDRLCAFADAVRRDGFTDVVLLGMGGSSLAPEVLRAVIGVAPGWPRFHMLDSTDPAAVIAAATTPSSTLYILASKSGTTIEPSSLASHFRRTLEDANVPRWADHFVAITDEDKPLARLARAERFRDLFINPSDIGGRYSALSFFGLVPAAVMGQDVAAIVGWGLAMLSLCEPDTRSAMTHPAVALGLAMGTGAAVGLDKLTLIVPPSLEPFGLWVEQLVAESTGKQGLGIVPIAGEPFADPSHYGVDRLFVRVRLARLSAGDAETRDLEAAQASIVELDMAEPCALGAEFVRWEVATAVAGALLRINPFDQPNVEEAKKATLALLDQRAATGSLPKPVSSRLSGSIEFSLSAAALNALKEQGPEAILALIRPGDYFALLAYLGPDPELAAELQAFRRAVRDRTRAATMFGYGPRYLHSTGQLHKGGPNTGVFVVISATPRVDVPIPDKPYSFGTLELAQALGDFTSLDEAALGSRRALHVHLPSPDPALVRQVAEALLGRLRATT